MKNSLQDVDFTSVILWGIKVGVAGYVLANYHAILVNIWDYLSGLAGLTQQSISGTWNKHEFVDNLMQSNIGPGIMIAMLLTSLFIFLAIVIIVIAMFVAVIGRIIEALVILAGAPIPMATFVSSATSNIGQNYLKNFMAIGLQGILIVAIYAIYIGLVQQAFSDMATSQENIIDTGQPLFAFIQSLLMLLAYTGVTAMMMFRTRDVAKILVGAS